MATNYNLSIIIPHYNNIDRLKRLFKSIPENETIEIIVVDDYSSNLSEEDLAYLNNERRIKFIKNSFTKSAGTARNIGLAASTKDYVLFADSDDYFITDLFEDAIVNAQKLNKDIVFFTPISYYEGTDIISKRAKPFNKRVRRYLRNNNKKNEHILRTKFHTPWSKLYRKEFLLFNKIQFDETKVANDGMFSLKAGLLANSIHAINSNVYVYTETKGSLVTIKKASLLKIRADVYLRYAIYLKEHLPKKYLKYHRFMGLKYIFMCLKSDQRIRKAINDLRNNRIDLL